MTGRGIDSSYVLKVGLESALVGGAKAKHILGCSSDV